MQYYSLRLSPEIETKADEEVCIGTCALLSMPLMTWHEAIRDGRVRKLSG